MWQTAGYVWDATKTGHGGIRRSQHLDVNSGLWSSASLLASTTATVLPCRVKIRSCKTATNELTSACNDHRLQHGELHSDKALISNLHSAGKVPSSLLVRNLRWCARAGQHW